MALKLACSSLRRVDRILKNGVFTGKLGIFPQVQPTSIRSRPFVDGPSVDPPQEFEQPVGLKQKFIQVIVETESAVDPMSYLQPGGWWRGQGRDTRKSSGPGSGGEGEIMKFKKIHLMDFAENFQLQPTTVKSLRFFRNNLVRVEMRPGASEDDGEILLFQIASQQEEEDLDEEHNMFLSVMFTTIGIVGLIGGCWAFLARYSKGFNWDSFVKGSFGRDTKEDAGMGSDIKTEYDADVRK